MIDVILKNNLKFVFKSVKKYKYEIRKTFFCHL